jgi:hypothetical protein
LNWLALALLVLAFEADGAETCAKCHPREYNSQIRTRHFRALRPISRSPVAEQLLNNPATDVMPHFERRGSAIAATARLAGQEETAILEWGFGAGAQGITPVGRIGDQFIEFRFSFYTRPRRFAPTFGHPERVATARAMLGLPQNMHTIATCFQCHSTPGAQGGGPDPGVRCERCHGPGLRHISIAEGGRPISEIRHSVLNPGRFTADAQTAFCGECHRLPVPGGDSPEPELENPVNVRFAPIGLMASRCFKQSGALACTACHDAHRDAAPRADLAYAKRCVSCHRQLERHTAVDQNCLQCHMRQAPAGPFLVFTDHRIRVY